MPLDKLSAAEPALFLLETEIAMEGWTAGSMLPPERCRVWEDVEWLWDCGSWPELDWLCAPADAELRMGAAWERLAGIAALLFTPLRAPSETPLFGTSASLVGFCCNNDGVVSETEEGDPKGYHHETLYSNSTARSAQKLYLRICIWGTGQRRGEQ